MAQCVARSKQSGERCKGQAVTGSDKCRMHGAGGGKARENADLKAVQQRAAVECARFGIPVTTDPVMSLLGSLFEQEGNVAYYRAEVSKLDEHFTETYLQSGGRSGETKAHALVDLYQRAVKDRDALALAMLKHDIEERRVRVTEQQARQVVQFAQGLMTDLGVDPSSPEARSAFRKRLELFAHGAEEVIDGDDVGDSA